MSSASRRDDRGDAAGGNSQHPGPEPHPGPELREAVLASFSDLRGQEHPALLAVSRLAAAICQTPMGAVTLVEKERQVFAAGVGLAIDEIDLESSFCAVAIATPDRPLLVDDLAGDARFTANPFVLSKALLSYHGYPLVTREGVALGTVCVLDERPRRLTASQHSALAQLAVVTVELLEAHRATRTLNETKERAAEALAAQQEAVEQLAVVFERSEQGMFLTESPGVVIRANAAFAHMIGREAAELVGVHASTLTHPDDVTAEMLRYLDLGETVRAAAAADSPGGPTGTLLREKRFMHADGSSASAITSSTMVLTDTPGRALVLNTVESVAERRAAETRMLELQSAVDGIIGLDSMGIVTSWNRGAERLFGRPAVDVLQQPLANFLAFDLLGELAQAQADGRVGELPEQTRQLPALRADGQGLLVELTLTQWEERGRVGYSAIVRDITRRRAAEQRAALVAFAARTANDATTFAAAAHLVLGEVGRQLSCTHAIAWNQTQGDEPAMWWVHEHGHEPGVACPLRRAAELGVKPEPVTGPSGRVSVDQAADLNRDTLTSAVTMCGLEAFLTVPVMAGGRVVAHLAFGLRAGASAAGPELLDALEQIGVQLGRVCEREATAAARDHQATHDPLTDLVNRRQLLTEISQAQEALADGSMRESTAVLLIDLDRFKLVNESLGHGAGDVVLQEVARRLVATSGPNDTVGRLGGDEFVVIARDLPANVSVVPSERNPAKERAAVLMAALRGDLEVVGHHVPLRASIGTVTLTHEHARAPELPATVLRDADSALLLAKRRGKDRIEAFTSSMRFDAATRLDDENDLGAAIANSELQVFYQPVVDLGTGLAVGAEALVRWPRPGHGLVPPNGFIPLAEESGLIVELGRWVLRQACADAASWSVTAPGLAGAPVNVNVSARQLAHPDFLAHVMEALDLAGLPPERLVIELTESVLIADGQTATVLHALRDARIRLALDDFGTGFSSLNYVQRLPVDILKIDKSFVDLITGPGQGTAFTEVVLKLSAAMGLSTTAEGVETPEQAQALADLGCHHGQGWTWARAVPLQELQASLPTPGALAGLALAGPLNRESGH